MKQLVYTETPLIYEEPYTTSLTIAEYAEIEHRAVSQMIRNHQGDLEEYGKTTFEMSKIKQGRGRKTKVYKLNEQQATLLITYLGNTKPVREFKKELVRQFFVMRNELMQRRAYRESEKETRKSLTSAIQNWQHKKNWSYKHITDLLCKAVTGMNTKQLKEARGIEANSAADLYTVEEFKKYEPLEQRVIFMLEMNLEYKHIKQFVNGQPLTHVFMNKQKTT